MPTSTSDSTTSTIPTTSGAAAVTPGFAALGVPAPLVDCLTAQGIADAFPIQVVTLPDSLAGKDVLGRGRTGSGKTIAFCLPLVARLAADRGTRTPNRPRGLVLVPTRELASQVDAVLQPLATALNLRTRVIVGGVNQRPQTEALRRGVDIVVATPGRLEDLMKQGHVRLDDVAISVLDEADHMADLGFLPAVRRILDATPSSGQRMLFSATLDNGVDVLVRRYLSNPVSHSVDDDATTEPDMEHHVLTVNASDKAAVVNRLAAGEGRSVLFTRTKHGARKLARDLTLAGIPAVDLHGNLAQNARERNLEAFRVGSVRVLVATDIAARGIHVDDIALVVHVDPPAEHKAYLHRSGRTARAGASGIVVTVQTDAQQREVATMTKRARITPTTTRVRPDSPQLLELSGPPAAHVPPAPQAAAPTSPGRSGRTGRGQRRGAPAGNPRQSRPARASDASPHSSIADFSAQQRRRTSR